jgi:hypothetical protein
MQEDETDLRDIELVLLRPRKLQTWLVEVFVGLSIIVPSPYIHSHAHSSTAFTTTRQRAQLAASLPHTTSRPSCLQCLPYIRLAIPSCWRLGRSVCRSSPHSRRRRFGVRSPLAGIARVIAAWQKSHLVYSRNRK